MAKLLDMISKHFNVFAVLVAITTLVLIFTR